MKEREETTESAEGWRRYRQEIRFLVLFVGILAVSFTLIAWNPVNDHVIEPFTGGIAKVSGATLKAIGQGTTMQGSVIRSPRFAVNIKNGCNGLETVIVFASAVLAFPAAWRPKLLGLIGGVLAIQLINLVRVVALFLTGAYFPSFFDSSHTVVWQSIVVACGVLLFLVWASRWAAPRPQAAG